MEFCAGFHRTAQLWDSMVFNSQILVLKGHRAARCHRLGVYVQMRECDKVKPGFSGTVTSLGEHMQD